MQGSEGPVLGSMKLARRGGESQEEPSPPVRVRCLLCEQVIEVPQPEEPAELVCPSCGVTFRYTPRPLYSEAPLTIDNGPLDRWLAGQPIQPRLPGRWEQFRTWASQSPWLVRSTLVLLAALMATSVVSFLAYRHACDRLSQAKAEIRQLQQHAQQVATQSLEAEQLARERQTELQREMAARLAAETRAREADTLRRKADEARQVAERRLSRRDQDNPFRETALTSQ